jgi:hypothetical protein
MPAASPVFPTRSFAGGHAARATADIQNSLTGLEQGLIHSQGA